MTKREAVLRVLEGGDGPQEYVPAAFFMHFDASCHEGQAAIEKHREFFRSTGMDFIKVQYERKYPHTDIIRTPKDWAKIPCFGRDFYAAQIDVVRALVEVAREEQALSVVTLYSPFMCAGHFADQKTLTAHLEEDPEATQKGLEIAAESLLLFVRECIAAGVDGFYHSTQGGEGKRFSNPSLFANYVKPTDLLLMEEIDRRCPFNILHICDYHKDDFGGYDDLTPFLDYPGHVVNCNPNVGGRTLSGAEIEAMFGRPFFGGMDRKGILATGTEIRVREEARAVLRDSSSRGGFLLGADCTVPAGTPWENLRAAIDEAHRGTGKEH